MASNRLHISKGKTNPRRIAVLGLFLFAVPPGWAFAAIGTLLVVVSVLVHGWAAGYLARAGNGERETVLTVRGPYRFNRNPYYVAHMTMDLGFFFLGGWPLLYLLYFPVIFSVYRRWVFKEEGFLEEAFGEDFFTLKMEVPRWGIRITPAPARGPDQRFSWSIFAVNGEWERAIPHGIILAGFLLYMVFGNPMIAIDSLVRFTLLGTAAIWYLLRDVYPVDVSQKSFGWTVAALAITAGAVVFLVRTPLWVPWSGKAAWASIGVGIGLGLIVMASVVPKIFGLIGKKNEHLFRRPMSQWFSVALSLGLISCSLGGIWIGITVPLILWALGIAGWIPIRWIPQRPDVGFGLAILFFVSGGLAAARWLI